MPMIVSFDLYEGADYAKAYEALERIGLYKYAVAENGQALRLATTLVYTNSEVEPQVLWNAARDALVAAGTPPTSLFAAAVTGWWSSA